MSDLSVEDQNDNGVLDKKEDINGTGTLDGDRLDSNLSTWMLGGKLDPFDIDNDVLVELPQNKGDPNSVPAGDEYDMERVFSHVITHEIGHSVGMGQGDPGMVDSLGHCFDPTCIMYQFSNNWNRQGHFCEYHQMLIRIHNN